MDIPCIAVLSTLDGDMPIFSIRLLSMHKNIAENSTHILKQLATLLKHI